MKLLVIPAEAFGDPRRWTYDWDVVNVRRIEGFREYLREQVARWGIQLPPMVLDGCLDPVDAQCDEALDSAAQAYLGEEAELVGRLLKPVVDDADNPLVRARRHAAAKFYRRHRPALREV